MQKHFELARVILTISALLDTWNKPTKNHAWLSSAIMMIYCYPSLNFYSPSMMAVNLTMTDDLFSVPKFIFNLQSCWTLLQEWSEIINVFLCKIRFLKYFLRRDHFWWNDFWWNDFLGERILLEWFLVERFLVERSLVEWFLVEWFFGGTICHAICMHMQQQCCLHIQQNDK